MNPEAEASARWFCLRSQPKHEHIAAAQRAKEPDIEAYLPRIRFRRPTRQGPKWFTEALFPNYLFARFELATRHRQVKNSRGVRDVVHFGERWPAVPNPAIDELRAAISGDPIHVLNEELPAGEVVQIAGGVFHGLKCGRDACVQRTVASLSVAGISRKPDHAGSVRRLTALQHRAPGCGFLGFEACPASGRAQPRH